ncbi:MAG: EAL domain-containing protein [Proteobacteria bacterium]|nr:EAL domain-containing protein [Pseudomonadota bacterium]
MKMTRLFKKTLLFMLLAFGVIAAVSSSYSAWSLRDRMTAEYESKALAIAKSMADSSAELILSQDATSIQSRIDQFLDINGVSYVLVASHSGEVMAHTFVPEIPEPVSALLWDLRTIHSGRIKAPVSLSLSLPGRGEFIHVAHPVLAGEIGSVHIGMDKGLINRAILGTILNQQILTLILFLTCAFAAYFFMENISRPLIKLTEYARKIRNRDFGATLDIDSKDELGELAGAFHSTSQELSGLISELEQAVEDTTGELQDTLSTVSAIVNNMADGLLVTDADGTLLQFNSALLEMFGATSGNLTERNARELLGTDMPSMMSRAGLDRCTLPTGDSSALPSGKRATIEVEGHRQDGTAFPAEMSLAVLPMHGDINVVGIIRDISKRKQTELKLQLAHAELEDRVAQRTAQLSESNKRLEDEAAERNAAELALRQAEGKYRGIFENAIEGIFQLAPDGTYIAANPALARIYGYATPMDLLGAAGSGMASFHVDESRGQEFWSQLLENKEIRGFESQARKRDGRIVWLTQNARPVHDENGQLLFYEGSVQDITERKEAESALRHQAFHDPLTGLPNRILFLDHLRLAMERTKRSKGFVYAVLYLDLDRFKIINDSLGHNIGDELLKHVARKLEEAVRTMDTVARFGGDEFAVLLEDMRAPREAIKIARRICDLVKEPAMLGGYEVHTSASLGIVLVKKDYDRPDSILRDADTAMYRAKESGRSRFKVFSQRMHDQNVRLLELETELRRSLTRDDFVTLLQPIVDLDNKRLAGFEALVRWNHPKLGMISPAEFIPLAEDTGLIHPLGEWVLRNVCGTIRDWEKQFPADKPLNISINLSAKQFVQPTLIPQLREILELTGITPSNLRLEVAETVLMKHATIAIEMLGQLKNLGISLSMDDFGTGYSSLSYLRQFPIDALKIDRSFISRFGEDAESQVLVRSIIALAKNIGVAVVAEGVDTEVQRVMLKDLGCEYAQGYLFARPMTREQAEGLLRGDEVLDI